MQNITRLLFISVFIFSCQNKLDYYQIGSKGGTPLDRIINFETSEGLTVEADDTTITEIKVRITKDASPNNRTINFKTSLGHFINDSSSMDIVADADGYAIAELMNPKKLGKCIIQAEIKGIRRTLHINFISSQPEYLQLFTDKIIYSKNDTIKVNARLFKQIGNVSDNIKVEFSFNSLSMDSVVLNYEKFVFCKNQNCNTLVNIISVKSATNLTVTAFCLIKSDTIKVEKIVYINP